MGNVHEHLLHFPVPDFNCSFTGEGVRIKTFISAVKRPCSHCSQASTGCQVKNGTQRILPWVEFISCSIQKVWVAFNNFWLQNQPPQEPVRTLAQTHQPVLDQNWSIYCFSYRRISFEKFLWDSNNFRQQLEVFRSKSLHTMLAFILYLRFWRSKQTQNCTESFLHTLL